MMIHMIKKNSIFLITVSVFLLFTLLGFLTAEITSINVDKSKLHPVFSEIYFQNLKVAIIILIGGFISAGIIPLFILIQNSIMFGVGIKNASYSLENLQYILTHGILEMPMFALVTFVSLKITYKLYTSKRLSFKKLILLLVISFSGLTIAALIETYITPKL